MRAQAPSSQRMAVELGGDPAPDPRMSTLSVMVQRLATPETGSLPQNTPVEVATDPSAPPTMRRLPSIRASQLPCTLIPSTRVGAVVAPEMERLPTIHGEAPAHESTQMPAVFCWPADPMMLLEATFVPVALPEIRMPAPSAELVPPVQTLLRLSSAPGEDSRRKP